ncbi:MAG: aminopeptidase [Treponema sp.]|nr:aminopeptidase [Treponema sp.]MCL2271524.1 aminopeptidase [Treponema sp.]
MKNLFSFLPVILTAAILPALCGLFSGCYTLTQGVTLLGYLNRAVPLEKTDDAEFKQLVMDIRSFAIDELGLVMSRNYTTYVELDRNYLAAVVSASRRDSFQRHEWFFPVVGKMPYKGFFNIEDARKERSKLEKKDIDVWIRRVSGFSTLGWFRDPLYSYMRDYSPARLADLLIHELVHSTVFIKGQVKFNEELAEFIGSEGARLYIEKRYGTNSDEYRNMFESEANSRNYISFIQELINELDVIYSSNLLNREEKLAEKERIIKASQERFRIEYENRFTNDDYRGFSELQINNAYLELFRLYYTEDNFFIDLYERCGHDLPALISAAKTIKKKGNPREQLENTVSR